MENNWSDQMNDSISVMPTGTSSDSGFRFLIYPFDRYEVTVVVDDDGQFLGISEIKINKEFLSYQQKLSRGVHDVEEFYQDE